MFYPIYLASKFIEFGYDSSFLSKNQFCLGMNYTFELIFLAITSQNDTVLPAMHVQC